MTTQWQPPETFPYEGTSTPQLSAAGQTFGTSGQSYSLDLRVLAWFSCFFYNQGNRFTTNAVGSFTLYFVDGSTGTCGAGTNYPGEPHIEKLLYIDDDNGTRQLGTYQDLTDQPLGVEVHIEDSTPPLPTEPEPEPEPESPTGEGSCGTGRYEYSCTCPDYTKRQPRLLAPIYPSDYRDRSWENSNAGALPGPPKLCKHIAAVANLLGDGEFYLGIDFGKDAPYLPYKPEPLPLSPDYKDPADFWKAVRLMFAERRRLQELNNNLDWLSRLRPEIRQKRHPLNYTEEITYTKPGLLGRPVEWTRREEVYIDYPTWGYDRTGQNLTQQQFQDYFRYQIGEAVAAKWW